MTIQGKTLGTCVINDFLVLFTHEPGIDRIYKVSNPVNNDSQTILLFQGDLGMYDTVNDKNVKVQTLPFYEGESIQKVYWIDGVNH